MIPDTLPWVSNVLGREEASIHFRRPDFSAILVTGAYGSIAQAVNSELDDVARAVAFTDIDDLDVRRPKMVDAVVEGFEPEVILHLAGAKHAPEGETDPQEAMAVNAIGTQNIIKAADKAGARVVMASTCKACDPETAYGASKLIAERMVLNAGGVVIRFYNVVETSGNVFTIWDSIPEPEPIPVAPTCERIFISLKEAHDLTLWALTAPTGRYTVAGVARKHMTNVAIDLYPGRSISWVAPRRGDRLVEPFCARSEQIEPYEEGIVRITSPHDPLGA